MKNDNERIYNKLKKQGLSDAEIAESFVFPSTLSPEQKLMNNDVLNAYRNATEEQREQMKKSEALIGELSVLARWKFYGEDAAILLYPQYEALIKTWRGSTYEDIKQQIYEKYR